LRLGAIGPDEGQTVVEPSTAHVPHAGADGQATDTAGQQLLAEDADLSGDDSGFDQIPDRLAGMYAQPALLDLLEDADSPDPAVSAEARRVLREHEMLPAEIGASSSAVE
jgi:hypothetical protein